MKKEKKKKKTSLPESSDQSRFGLQPHLSLVLVETVDVDQDGEDENGDGDEKGGAAGELVVGSAQRNKGNIFIFR